MAKNIQYLICAAAVLCFGIVLRATVSLHSYSGQHQPPMFGDFEAQRHWQEVTVNLPVADWYRNTSDNDLMYWGLDYPPLTACHSFAMGLIAGKLNLNYVELHVSRGISTPDHKNFMRNTVLVADGLLYLPAMFLASIVIADLSCKLKGSRRSMESSILHLVVLVAYPGQILIDNGHFQYNNLSLGLAALAVISIFLDKNILSAIFFSLALNYKQMELYHAIPVFIILLRRCFPPNGFRFVDGLLKLIKIGCVVIVTFFILWVPWMTSFDAAAEVVKRIFPLARGVFEDKVSSFWCVLNVFIKIRENFTNEVMAVVCLLSTLLSVMPSTVHLFVQPTGINFLYSLVNVALSFFLFSFQVHEKSILLVALPILLLFPFEPVMSFWFLQVSTFSIFPLLVKDGLTTAFVATNIVFILVVIVTATTENLTARNLAKFLYISTQTPKEWNWSKHLLSIFYYLSTSMSIILGLCHIFVEPPTRLPHIFPLAISAYSCLHFIMFLSYFNYRQILNNKNIL